MNTFYNSKQSRIRKLVPFICNQNRHRLFAMLELNPSFVVDLTLQPKLKVKVKISMFPSSLYYFYGTNCALKSKELLRDF